MKDEYRIYETFALRACFDLLVGTGICRDDEDFWRNWADLSGKIPSLHDPYVCLSSHNLDCISANIGADAIIIDDSIERAASKTKEDDLYREIEVLELAFQLIQIAKKSHFSRN